MTIYKTLLDTKDIDAYFITSFMNACLACGNPGKGIEIYSETVTLIKDPNIPMLRMLSKLCGTAPQHYAPKLALSLLHSLQYSVTAKECTILIKAFTEKNNLEAIRNVLAFMDCYKIPFDEPIYVSLLKAAGVAEDLSFGTSIYNRIIFSGIAQTPIILTALLTMYYKSGELEKAYSIFQTMVQNSVDTIESWNSILAGLLQHGQRKRASDLYDNMLSRNVQPNQITYRLILNIYVQMEDLRKVQSIFSSIESTSTILPAGLGNAVLLFFTKSKDLKTATKVFHYLLHMQTATTVTWNIFLTSLINLGEAAQAITHFQEMKKVGFNADETSYTIALKACALVKDIDTGKALHHQLLNTTFYSPEHKTLQGSLLNMYAKCGDFNQAFTIFEQLRNSGLADLISWSALITAYAQHNQHEKAQCLFDEMVESGIQPDAILYTCMLSVCANNKDCRKGRALHDLICKQQIPIDSSLHFALINLYLNCGELTKSFELFTKMLDAEILPHEAVFVSLLTACADSSRLDLGKQIHDVIVKHNIKSTTIDGALMSMYAKCDSTAAFELFSKLHYSGTADTRIWTSFINGLVMHKRYAEAIEHFKLMLSKQVIPNEFTFSVVFTACSHLGQRKLALRLYEDYQNSKSNVTATEELQCSLITMLGKCAEIEKARLVFDALNKQDINVATWTAMLQGYADQGNDKEATKLFNEMQNYIEVNAITCLSLLTALSHAYQADATKTFVETMQAQFHITPTIKHFNCVVDALSRVGQVEAAEEYIKQHIPNPDISTQLNMKILT